MKKIIMLILGLFLLTGCAVKYNLVINDDLSVVEEAKLTGTDNFFANYYKTTRTNVLKDNIEIYQDILDENNYQYELKEDTVPYVLVTRKYNDALDYVNNSKLFNDYFDEVKYTEDGDIKKIETIGFHENDIDNPERFIVSELEITIKCPFEVKNHNAQKVDESENVYYYKLDNENNKILLEYDVSKKYNPNAEIIRIIIICILIIIACWITVIVLNKKSKKNN